MLGVLDGNHYLYRCLGSTAPDCWTIQGGGLSFIGKYESFGAPYPIVNDGFPMISGQTFDRSKFISAEMTITAHCDKNGVTDSGCYLGLTLIGNETDYRAITILRWAGFAPNKLLLYAGGPKQQLPLMWETGPLQGVHASIDTDVPTTLRIDYLGPNFALGSEAPGVRYYVNGQRLTVR